MGIQTVVLPNGERVHASSEPQSWWTQHGSVGHVHPGCLAPDPQQPRKFMHPSRLAELRESVRSRGIRSAIIVTPRCKSAWASVAPEDSARHLLIVSGHRRTRVALESGLEAVPIEIRIYANEMEHRSDVSLLNKGQDPLSELEEGFEVLALRNAGWTLIQLAEHFGWNMLTIRGRLNLTRLDTNIQALLRPDLAEKDRLPVTTAQHLGGLESPTAEKLLQIADDTGETIGEGQLVSEDSRRFALQRLLVSVIRKRGLNTTRATHFIKTLSAEYRKGGHGHRATKLAKPSSRRDMLETVAKSVIGSPVVDWSPAEYERILGLASREDIEGILTRIDNASDVLSGIGAILRRIRDKRKPTSPEVQRLLARAR